MPSSDDDDHHNDSSPWNHKDMYDLNSKIMLTAIISLSVVIIMVLALHIYARCVLRRRARRRAAISDLAVTMAPPNATEQPKTGLDPAIINSLPTFVFKLPQGDEEATATLECAVCLSMLEDEETARLLPNCKHTFHAGCIDKWLSSHSTCPICRTEAEPQLQPEPREGPASAEPSAPPLEGINCVSTCMEGTSSDGGIQASTKASGSTSRLSSFRRMLSRKGSSRAVHTCSSDEDAIEDLERQ